MKANQMLVLTNMLAKIISELDDVKLIDCADCKSVRYCSDNCREDHRLEHEAKCKERAAELRDEILFKQPESNQSTTREQPDGTQQATRKH